MDELKILTNTLKLNSEITRLKKENEKYINALQRIHDRSWPTGDVYSATKHASRMWEISDDALQQQSKGK